MSVHSHADKYNAPDSVHDELTKLDRNWDVQVDLHLSNIHWILLDAKKLQFLNNLKCRSLTS